MTRTADWHYRKARERLKVPGVLCVLCGQEIDLTITDPYDDMSFQSDHLTAIENGGSNHGELVPMHRICNLRKGIKGLDEVRYDRHSRRHY